MENLRNILDKFTGKNILLIGDIMLDKYLYGDVSRISPEAPVPVVRANKEENKIGGAGNVASNLSTLGSNVTFFSFIGPDKEADILKGLLDKNNIEYFLDADTKTTTKFRIIGSGQQLIRIDQEETSPKVFSQATKNILLEKAKYADIILVSDYAKGAVTSDLIETLKDFKLKTIIHPKPANKNVRASEFMDVKLIIPNEKEASEMSGLGDVYESGELLRKNLNSNILITRGEKGMALFSENRIEIPTYAKEVFDVQGASDTVVATVALSIASQASLEEAAILGNHAAGIAVEKKGTYSVKLDELKNRVLYGERKIVSFEEIKSIIHRLKEKGEKIVWTNGCFDLFHAGHRFSLEKAKEKGDILIVGIDSDDSVKRLKGPSRPICSEKERAELLSSIEFVDYVTIFPYGGAVEYIRELKPDVYVKSGDYTLETINQEERKIIEGYGGEIYLPKGIPGLSTTDIIKRIKNNK